MEIEENVQLKDFTTFRIGGPAQYFIRVTSIADLQIAMPIAKSRNVPIFVLGGGSNILVSDEGYKGLVIKMEIGGVDYMPEKEGKIVVSAGAGVDWDSFVAETVHHGLSGLENLSLIPGTVGAAPVQNIGAYGAEAKDTIAWVEALDVETGEMRHFENAECEFGYRMSVFKKPEGKKYIITRVGFALTKDGKPNTSYRDIAEYIKTNNVTELSTQKVRDMVIDIRTRKLPSVKEYGTAGSFFKNPIISEKKYKELSKKFPALPNFPAGNGKVKVPAAWILDNVCGFKGYKNGNVGVYKNQALVLVNFGNASSEEIKNLAQKMIDCVKNKTGITLEREVEYV